MLIFILMRHLLSYILTCLLFYILAHHIFLQTCHGHLITDYISGQTHVKTRKTHRKTCRIEMNMLTNHSISSSWEQLQRILNMKIIWHIIIWLILRLKVRLIIWWMRYCLMMQQSISELEHTLKSHFQIESWQEQKELETQALFQILLLTEYRSC